MTQQEKILDRIKKLLSLANSSNEHEAALAAARATKLMLEHGIAEAQLEETDERENVGKIELEEGTKLPKWKSVVLNGLSIAFDCIHYYSRRRGAYGKRSTVFIVVGQPSKTATITYMYTYLVKEIERLADAAYGEEARECQASGIERPGARAWKNAFRVGAAQTIASRVIKENKKVRAQAKAAGQSLVRIDQDKTAVEVFVKNTVGPLGAGSGIKVSSRSGYAAGAAAGKNVGLGGGKGLGAGNKRLGS